jgi:hypothetical protein
VTVSTEQWAAELSKRTVRRWQAMDEDEAVLKAAGALRDGGTDREVS